MLTEDEGEGTLLGSLTDLFATTGPIVLAPEPLPAVVTDFAVKVIGIVPSLGILLAEVNEASAMIDPGAICAGITDPGILTAAPITSATAKYISGVAETGVKIGGAAFPTELVGCVTVARLAEGERPGSCSCLSATSSPDLTGSNNAESEGAASVIIGSNTSGGAKANAWGAPALASANPIPLPLVTETSSDGLPP